MMGVSGMGRRIWRSVQLAVGVATVVLAVAATCEKEPEVDCGYAGMQTKRVCDSWSTKVAPKSSAQPSVSRQSGNIMLPSPTRDMVCVQWLREGRYEFPTVINDPESQIWDESYRRLMDGRCNK